MRKKRDFECSMVVIARGAGLSMSETADVLKFSHAITSRIYTTVNDLKKEERAKFKSSPQSPDFNSMEYLWELAGTRDHGSVANKSAVCDVII